MVGPATCGQTFGNWDGIIPFHSFPELYSFAKVKTIRIQDVKIVDSVTQLFHLLLSGQAYDHLLTLLAAIESVTISDDPDVWSCIWGSHLYSSSKAYMHLCGSAIVHPCYSWLWKASTQNKLKLSSGYSSKIGSEQEVC